MFTAGSSAKSIKNATAAMIEQINAAKTVQGTARDQNTALWSPVNQVGQNSLQKWSDLITGNPATQQQTLENLPGYQFALNQGLRGVTNNATALGMRQSGASQKALDAYGSGLASQNYGNYAQQLQQLATTGLNGTANLANTNTNYANAMQGLDLQQGAAASNGILAKTAALNQGWGGLFNGIDQAAQQAMTMGMGGMGGAGTFGGGGSGVLSGSAPMSAGASAANGITWF